MLVVHGAWVPAGQAPGRFALWAEDPSPPPAAAGRGRPRPHPFAAPAAALAATLAAALDAPAAERPHGAGASGPDTGPGTAGDGPRDGGGSVGHGTLVLLLPGAGREPAASPELGRAAARRRRALGAWRVPALLLGPAAAAAALPALADPGPDAGWLPGGALRWLGLLAEHAADLVRRGRMLPQLVVEAGTPAARWRPVHTGADAAAYRDLVTALPPVCRAAADAGAAAVTRDALDALVDAAARAAVPERLVGGPRPGRGSPLADRWAAALTAADPALPGAPEADVAALRAALSAWRDAACAADGPARVSFRLVEPPPGADGWRLDLALQSTADPGLWLSAADLWAGAGLPGLTAPPDETLLAGLGRAVRLYPALHTALYEPRPAALALDTAGAADFLRHAAPLLSAAGFGVQLPAWAGRRAVGVKLTARTRSTGAGGAAAPSGFGLADLVSYRLDLVVDGETVDPADLAGPARLKVGLVRVRGRWVELDERQLAAALAAVDARHGEATAGEVLRRVAAGGADDLPLVGVDAGGPLGDLLSGEAADRLAPVPTPAGFRGELRPYQQRGLSWLSFLSRLGLGGILADDMGLGKTAQTLALLVAERAGAPVGPTLLLCPASLLSNWRHEAARFAPDLRVVVHHGAGRDRDADLAAADLVVTTYGTAVRDLAALRAVPWHRVVCDEAQAVKNAATRQARAVRALPARTRLALTGTPVENHLAELWSIMEFCNPGLLGPARRFRRRYAEPIETRGDADAAAALRRATGPFVLRRVKTDKAIIADLPDKVETTEWCPLTPEQAALYRAVVEDLLAVVDASTGVTRRGLVLTAMTRLKQVCNHPAHLLGDGSPLAGRSGKLTRLEELAARVVGDGAKALVFTQYAAFGAMLAPYLAAHLARPVLWLHGGLPVARRDALVRRFTTDDEPMLLLASLKAAGTGLNLTAATHVIHVDRWWNPAVEDQATDRAYRIGQTSTVQVHRLVCPGTLEERLDEMIGRKRDLARRVVGTGEERLADLDTDALRALLTLDPREVG